MCVNAARHACSTLIIFNATLQPPVFSTMLHMRPEHIDKTECAANAALSGGGGGFNLGWPSQGCNDTTVRPHSGPSVWDQRIPKWVLSILIEKRFVAHVGAFI